VSAATGIQPHNPRVLILQYRIIKIIKTFYYSASEEILFIYLQNDLKSHQIFGNYNFWEKYILLAIRNTLRQSKFDLEEKEGKTDAMKDIVFQKLAEIIDIVMGFGLPKDVVSSLIISFCESVKLTKKYQEVLNQEIQLYGLTEEEKEQMITIKSESQPKKSSGWFGFSTSTFSKMGAMLIGSEERVHKRASSTSREDEEHEEQKEYENHNRTQHITSSFITPTKGESNSDYVRESSGGGSIEYSREYDKREPFELVEVIEEIIEKSFEETDSQAKSKLISIFVEV
jgi:hypothetical protein